jgi:hypothetical protein
MWFRRVAAMNALAALVFYGSICVCAHAAAAAPCSAHEAQGSAPNQHPEPARSDGACGHCGALDAELGQGKPVVAFASPSPSHVAQVALVPHPASDALAALRLSHAGRPPPGPRRPLFSLTRTLRL